MNFAIGWEKEDIFVRKTLEIYDIPFEKITQYYKEKAVAQQWRLLHTESDLKQYGYLLKQYGCKENAEGVMLFFF